MLYYIFSYEHVLKFGQPTTRKQTTSNNKNLLLAKTSTRVPREQDSLITLWNRLQTTEASAS